MSEINVSRAEANAAVAVIAVVGDLDGANYEQVIALAKREIDAGAKHILVDLSGVEFMSSAGLVALNSIARLLQGGHLPGTEDGWAAMRNVRAGLEDGLQANIKLVSPQAVVDRALDASGMKAVYEIHDDLAAAVASFG
jgi:ABC-type transporter Mla MlaB component